MTLVGLLGVGLALASCGGGAGGDAAGQGLVLTSFLQDGLDNLPLNTELEFDFSEAVNPATVSDTTIQIREGPQFGVSVPGVFSVAGSVVKFRPRLPGLCDRSDAGFKSDKNYQVTVLGHPEEYSVRNAHGQPLSATITFQFHTLPDGDPGLFLDHMPGSAPTVVSSIPADGDAAVTVAQGNKVVLTISENLEPCSVDTSTVFMHQVQVGDPNAFLTAPNGNATGFDSITDASPDPYSWGATNSTTQSPPQIIPATVALSQTFDQTTITLTPLFGQFPDNALLVVEMTSGVADFSGQLMAPFVMGFTTENKAAGSGTFALDYNGEVSIDKDASSADVNTARSPSRAQGYLLFSGDGDNGANLLMPSLPETPASGCTLARQNNDGTKDDFDPTADVVLDTGATGNTCPNGTDGSTAVVWEFNSFRIRSGVTVRVVGSNPAILLVNGDIRIDSGGILRVRGDNVGGAPQSRGLNGTSSSSSGTRAGGAGVAGGGKGGSAYHPTAGSSNGGPGFSGAGSPDYDPAQAAGGSGEGGVGGGGGGTPDSNCDTFGSGASQGGGGGGHATPGTAGQAHTGLNTYGCVHSYVGPIKGAGGGTYPTGPLADQMRTPSAGSGGGAAGDSRGNGGTYDCYGGSGGAGGGFVDLTCRGDVTIQGTIDAAGSAGGNGYYDASFTASGGGGGGAGGGIRLLTPMNIDLTGATLTTSGGPGGTASSPTSSPNYGGAGGNGRIAMEDGDSVISGIAGATLVPAEGDVGYYRGTFDASRFVGGGLTPAAVTDVFLAGPLNPDYTVPVAADFTAGIPVIASRGAGTTSILVEAQAFPIKVDGTADTTAPSGWYTVGYFSDSGVVGSPTWHPGAQPGDVTLPADNAGVGIDNLDHLPMIQVRVTFYLPTGLGPFDGGPYVDLWNLKYTFDQ